MTTTTGVRLAPGDATPPGVALDGAAQQVPLSVLWSGGPALLVFLRHIGWIFCREELARLAGITDRVRELGATLAALTLAQPVETAAFCAAHAPAVLCLCDPDGRLYDLYGLRAGTTRQLVGPRVWAAGLRAALRGQRVGRPGSDTRRLAGSFVVDAAGRIVLAHYAAHAGDRAPTEALLAALSSAGASSGPR